MLTLDWEVLEIMRKFDLMGLVRIPSNTGYFRDLVQNQISANLSEDQRTSLRDTPFSGYLDVPDLPMQPVIMDCLLGVFNVEKSSFKIGGKWTSLGVEELRAFRWEDL
ncbi:uncharacterized protein A4U43_C09F2770 [Asparagus officinalis]|uniref:Uncharacterized protein n=1 Tax=Asparagus officinalis TaxID=4686 RepID=A0A5P1E526_ASPOF|nr:uncharacterized protein A4U43_C09F2770 [Asparagus officinalis]